MLLFVKKIWARHIRRIFVNSHNWMFRPRFFSFPCRNIQFWEFKKKLDGYHKKCAWYGVPKFLKSNGAYPPPPYLKINLPMTKYLNALTAVWLETCSPLQEFDWRRRLDSSNKEDKHSLPVKLLTCPTFINKKLDYYIGFLS